MARHTITLIPGDGVGPEVSTAARRVIDATGVDIDWEVHDAGLGVMEQYGDPLVMNTYLKVTILVLAMVCVSLSGLTYQSQKALADIGWKLGPNPGVYGGYEAIQRHPGRYAAATEMRKDGTALAY